MNGFVYATQPMATFDLPATDSDVNVTVTAMNVFGSGPASTFSNTSMSKIGKLCEFHFVTCVQPLSHPFNKTNNFYGISLALLGWFLS